MGVILMVRLKKISLTCLFLLVLILGACGEEESSNEGFDEDEDTIEVSVGRQAWAAGNSPVIQYMMENELFEQYAEDFGYELSVEYQDHPSAAPMVEAMVSGNLDFGMWGNTPIIRNLAAEQNISALNVGEGHLRYVLVTREGSEIRNLDDLEGKTVGLLVGGDPHNAFNQMLRYHLNVSDPGEMNIELVNVDSFSQAAQVPKGMDATVTYLPALLEAQENDEEITTVLNAFGETGEYWKDDEFEGEGHLLESVKDSPFYPDGYYLHRSMWVVNNQLIDSHPDVVTAFVMAQEKAIEELDEMDPGEISQTVKEYWELEADLGKQIIEDELLFLRGWSWPTEGDAQSMIETSKFMAEAELIDSPLAKEDVLDNFERVSNILEKAYGEMDKKPEEDEFKEEETDVRGLPAWDLEEWNLKE